MESQKQTELQDRAKKFAVRIVHMARAFPNKPDSDVIRKQILRSATSVAANYRAVARSRSRSEFVAKMGVVVEECDETLFWLEFIRDVGLLPPARLQPLISEAQQLVSIFAASYRTARSGQN